MLIYIIYILIDGWMVSWLDGWTYRQRSMDGWRIKKMAGLNNRQADRPKDKMIDKETWKKMMKSSPWNVVPAKVGSVWQHKASGYESFIPALKAQMCCLAHLQWTWYGLIGFDTYNSLSYVSDYVQAQSTHYLWDWFWWREKRTVSTPSATAPLWDVWIMRD